MTLLPWILSLLLQISGCISLVWIWRANLILNVSFGFLKLFQILAVLFLHTGKASYFCFLFSNGRKHYPGYSYYQCHNSWSDSAGGSKNSLRKDWAMQSGKCGSSWLLSFFSLALLNIWFVFSSKIFLNKQPNPKKKLLVPCALDPPNPNCYVCASKPEVTVKLNVYKVTVLTLQDKVNQLHFFPFNPCLNSTDRMCLPRICAPTDF